MERGGSAIRPRLIREARQRGQDLEASANIAPDPKQPPDGLKPKKSKGASWRGLTPATPGSDRKQNAAPRAAQGAGRSFEELEPEWQERIQGS